MNGRVRKRDFWPGFGRGGDTGHDFRKANRRCAVLLELELNAKYGINEPARAQIVPGHIQHDLCQTFV